MSNLINTGKQYIATFYLVEDGGRKTWWIVYYYITMEKFMERFTKVEYSMVEFRKLLKENEVKLALPIRDYKHYVDFAKELGLMVEYHRKTVGLNVVEVPVIYFNDDSDRNITRLGRHVLFTVAHTTYDDPEPHYQVLSRVVRSCSRDVEYVIFMFDALPFSRFGDYWRLDDENQLENVVQRVLRVGKAFRVLYDFL